MSNQLSRDELLANLLERQAADLAEREARYNRKRGRGRIGRAVAFVALLLVILVGGYEFFLHLPQLTAMFHTSPSISTQQQRPYVPNIGQFVGSPQTGAGPQTTGSQGPSEPPAPGKQAEGATDVLRDMPAMQPVTAPQPEGGKMAQPENKEASPQGKVAQPEESAPAIEQQSAHPGKAGSSGPGASSGIGGGARP